MTSSEQQSYHGREQAAVKHDILRNYLMQFACKVSSWRTSITYIDGFSGPWQSRAANYSDTSFGVALDVLKRARDSMRLRGTDFTIRCAFVEKDRRAYGQLKRYTDSLDLPNAEIKAFRGSFEGQIPELIQFTKEANDNFTFSFIDPKGWSNSYLDRIAGLLAQENSEVLITFMTDFLRRAAGREDEQTAELVSSILNTTDAQAELQQIDDPESREKWFIKRYKSRLAMLGKYRYPASTLILYPGADRTLYHLIYGTRHLAGLEVFRNVERRAMELQSDVRAEAAQRKRIARTRQQEFLSAQDTASTFLESRMAREQAEAQDATLSYIRSRRNLFFAELVAYALLRDFVSLSDVRDWMRGWRRRNLIAYEGLAANEKTPKLGPAGQNHRVKWVGA